MLKLRFEHIVSTVVFSLFLLLLNTYYEQIQFLSADFDQILGFYSFVVLVGIVFSVVQAFYANKYFDLLAQVVNNVFFVVVAFIFWILFPFDTSVIGDTGTWDIIFRILIVLPVFPYTFTTIYEVVKILRQAKENREQK